LIALPARRHYRHNHLVIAGGDANVSAAMAMDELVLP